MSKKTGRGKLRIHRETLRTLSDARLARVAGGDFGLAPTLVLVRVGEMDNTLPRSNAWTGDNVNVPTC